MARIDKCCGTCAWGYLNEETIKNDGYVSIVCDMDNGLWHDWGDFCQRYICDEIELDLLEHYE